MSFGRFQTLLISHLGWLQKGGGANILLCLVGTVLPLAGGVGLLGPVTTSPRLEVELSPDLLQKERANKVGQV